MINLNKKHLKFQSMKILIKFRFLSFFVILGSFLFSLSGYCQVNSNQLPSPGKPQLTPDGEFQYFSHWGQDPWMNEMINERIFTQERWRYFMNRTSCLLGGGLYFADTPWASISYGEGPSPVLLEVLININIPLKHYGIEQSRRGLHTLGMPESWWMTTSRELTFHPFNPFKHSNLDLVEIQKRMKDEISRLRKDTSITDAFNLYLESFKLDSETNPAVKILENKFKSFREDLISKNRKNALKIECQEVLNDLLLRQDEFQQLFITLKNLTKTFIEDDLKINGKSDLFEMLTDIHQNLHIENMDMGLNIETLIRYYNKLNLSTAINANQAIANFLIGLNDEKMIRQYLTILIHQQANIELINIFTDVIDIESVMTKEQDKTERNLDIFKRLSWNQIPLNKIVPYVQTLVLSSESDFKQFNSLNAKWDLFWENYQFLDPLNSNDRKLNRELLFINFFMTKFPQIFKKFNLIAKIIKSERLEILNELGLDRKDIVDSFDQLNSPELKRILEKDPTLFFAKNHLNQNGLHRLLKALNQEINLSDEFKEELLLKLNTNEAHKALLEIDQHGNSPILHAIKSDHYDWSFMKRILMMVPNISEVIDRDGNTIAHIFGRKKMNHENWARLSWLFEKFPNLKLIKNINGEIAHAQNHNCCAIQ
jgi:hypothetical protein